MSTLFAPFEINWVYITMDIFCKFVQFYQDSNSFLNKKIPIILHIQGGIFLDWPLSVFSPFLLLHYFRKFFSPIRIRASLKRQVCEKNPEWIKRERERDWQKIKINFYWTMRAEQSRYFLETLPDSVSRKKFPNVFKSCP